MNKFPLLHRTLQFVLNDFQTNVEQSVSQKVVVDSVDRKQLPGF